MLQSSHEAAEASMAKTGSGSTSPGESVDEVLDATTLVPPSPSSASTPFNVDASTLSLRLSTINSFSQSIASNPLIQAEMARMFLKDEKLVHELLSQGVDLDDLTRACFINPSGFIPGSSSLKLLPPIAQDQSTQGGAQDRRVDEEEGNEEDRQPLHHHVLEVVKVALEATGGAFQWLGGWIKDRAQEVFGTQNDAQDHHRTEGVEELDTNQARQTRAGGGAGSKILDISLIVLSIVFVLLILRRPLASFRIVRAAI